MRTSMAYFAGVGTVVAAVTMGLGGGLLISNIVSPHEQRTGMSKLELHTASKTIPAATAPSEPVTYLAATAPAASGPITVATPAPPTEPASGSSPQAQPAEAQGAANATAGAQPAASPPQAATPVAQAANSEKTNSEQIKAPENAFARARDADARREARRLEQSRRAERRQQWAERRRPRQDQELRDVEAKVREETEPRQAFTAEPARLEMPRIKLFGAE